MSLVVPTVDEVLDSIKLDLKSRLGEGFKYDPEKWAKIIKDNLSNYPIFNPVYSVNVDLDKSTGMIKVVVDEL